MSDKLNPMVIYDYILTRLDAIRAQHPNRVCVFYLLLGSYPGYYLENPGDETRLHCCPQIIPSLDSYVQDLHQEVIHCDELYKVRPQTVLAEHTYQPQTPGNTLDQCILEYRFPMYTIRALLDRLAALPAFFYIQNTTGIPYPFDELAYMENQPNVYFTVSDCMLNTLDPVQLPALNPLGGRWENHMLHTHTVKQVEIPLLIDVIKCILMGESVHHVTARDRPAICIARDVMFDMILPQQLDSTFEIYVRPYLFHRLTGNIRQKYLAKYLRQYKELAETLDLDSTGMIGEVDAWLESLAQLSQEAGDTCMRIHHLFHAFLDQLLSTRASGSLQQVPVVKYLCMVLTLRQLQVTDADSAPKYLPMIEYIYQQMLILPTATATGDGYKEIKATLFNW